MQKILEEAARWYIAETGFTTKEMQHDLRGILRHREQALKNGNLEQIYKSFACSEIAKAAICLSNGEDYETTFSKLELGYIKQIAGSQNNTFICPKCGQEYPAEAFAPGSRFCISCDKEIKLLRRQAQKAYSGGYINQRGAIICAI